MRCALQADQVLRAATMSMLMILVVWVVTTNIHEHTPAHILLWVDENIKCGHFDISVTYVRILYDILEGLVCEGLECFCI